MGEDSKRERQRLGKPIQYRVPMSVKKEILHAVMSHMYDVDRDRRIDIGPSTGLVMRWWIAQSPERQLEILRAGLQIELSESLTETEPPPPAKGSIAAKKNR